MLSTLDSLPYAKCQPPDAEYRPGRILVWSVVYGRKALLPTVA
jgi:hypothetical protein